MGYTVQESEWDVVFNRGIRNGLTEKVTFEQRSEGGLRNADWCREMILGRGYKSTEDLRQMIPHVLEGQQMKKWC